MAMGVPVFGTRAAGLEEIIVPGETGTLSAPSDPAALAQSIEELLREPARLEAMGGRARARVLGDFDAERNFQRLLGLFQRGAEAPAPAVAAMEVAS
jgi:glycosyltransferase involved in cell wall biosynthesis